MGTFRSREVQQGDLNALASFIKFTHHVLEGLNNDICKVYLNNIFIYAKSYN